jgi:hypothetical protein
MYSQTELTTTKTELTTTKSELTTTKTELTTTKSELTTTKSELTTTKMELTTTTVKRLFEQASHLYADMHPNDEVSVTNVALPLVYAPNFDLPSFVDQHVLDERGQALLNDRVAKAKAACGDQFKDQFGRIIDKHVACDEAQIMETLAKLAAEKSGRDKSSSSVAPKSRTLANKSVTSNEDRPGAAATKAPDGATTHVIDSFETENVHPVVHSLVLCLAYALSSPVAHNYAKLVDAAACEDADEEMVSIHVYDRLVAESMSNELWAYMEGTKITNVRRQFWKRLVPKLAFSLGQHDIHRRTDAGLFAACRMCDFASVGETSTIDLHALVNMATSVEAKSVLDLPHVRTAVHECVRCFWSTLRFRPALISSRMPMRVFVITSALYWLFLLLRVEVRDSKPHIVLAFANKVYRYDNTVPCAASAPTGETPIKVFTEQKFKNCAKAVSDAKAKSLMFLTSLPPASGQSNLRWNERDVVALTRTEFAGELSSETSQLLSMLPAVIRFNHGQPTAPVMGAFDTTLSPSGTDAPALIEVVVDGVVCQVNELLSSGGRSVVVRGVFGDKRCVVKYFNNATNVRERGMYRDLVAAGVPHLPDEVRGTVFEPLANVIVQNDNGARSLEHCCLRADDVANRVLELLFVNIKVALQTMHKKGFLMVDLHIGNIVVVFDPDGAIAELQLVDFESVVRLGDGDSASRHPTNSPVRMLAGETLSADSVFDVEFDMQRFSAVVNWVRHRGAKKFADCGASEGESHWEAKPDLTKR